MKLWLEACHATATGAARAVDAAQRTGGRAGQRGQVLRRRPGARPSSRTASSSTAGSGSPGTTTSTSTCAGWSRTARCSGPRADHRERIAVPRPDCRSDGHGTERARSRTEDVEAFRAPGPGLAGRQHAPRCPRGSRTASSCRDDEDGPAGPRAPAHAVRRRLRRHLLPGRVRGPRPEPGPPAGLHPASRSPTRCRWSSTSPTLLHPRPPPCSTSAPRSRSSATSPRSCAGDELWVQFLSEPTRRVRPGRPGHPGHPRRRRLHAERLEDLELGRLPGRLRPVPGPHQLARPQAPRASPVHRQDPPAGHRGPADQDGRTAGTSSARSSSTTCVIPAGERGGRGQRRVDRGHPAAGPRAQRRGRGVALHAAAVATASGRGGGPQHGPAGHGLRAGGRPHGSASWWPSPGSTTGSPTSWSTG